MDIQDYIIVLITVAIVFAVSVMNEKGKSVRTLVQQKNLPIRWTVYFALIFYIIIFGAYGPGYVQLDPIYADF